MAVRKLEDAINQGVEWLDEKISWTWLLFLLAGFYFAWEVLMRYAFDSPHSWFEETSVILCVLVSFLGAGRATRIRTHITLDVLYVRFGQRTRQITNIITYLVTIIVSITIIFGVIKYALFLNYCGSFYESTLRTPYSALCWPVIIGMLLNMLFSLRALIRVLHPDRYPEEVGVSYQLGVS